MVVAIVEVAVAERGTERVSLGCPYDRLMISVWFHQVHLVAEMRWSCELGRPGCLCGPNCRSDGNRVVVALVAIVVMAVSERVDANPDGSVDVSSAVQN